MRELDALPFLIMAELRLALSKIVIKLLLLAPIVPPICEQGAEQRYQCAD
jgi:hypothetical protein